MIKKVTDYLQKCMLFLCIISIISNTLFAKEQNWQWVTGAGGKGWDRGNAIKVDEEGSSYITGYFQGEVNFGNQILTKMGYKELFVCKLDKNGNFIWANQMTSSEESWGEDIAIDNAKNSYVVGCFEGKTNFGSHTLIASGKLNLFVAKLDRNGKWLWAGKAITTLGQIDPKALTLDSAGNIYVTGLFYGKSNFGSHSLTSNSGDMFLAKMNPAGNWLWAIKGIGENGYGLAEAVEVDNSGNIYVAGWFEEEAVFGDHKLKGSGDRDIFVAKLNSSVYWLWARKAGGNEEDNLTDIVVDNSGNCYLTGYFRGETYFGPNSVSSVGGDDIYLAKLDRNGLWQNVKRAGGKYDDRALGIDIDRQDEKIYITGCFTDLAKFGAYTLPGYNKEWDVFTAKVNKNLNWLGVEQAGGWNADMGYDISVSQFGLPIITGGFQDVARFDTLKLSIPVSDNMNMFATQQFEFEYEPLSSRKTVTAKTIFYKEFLDSDRDYLWRNLSELKQVKIHAGKLVVSHKNKDRDYYSVNYFNINPEGQYYIETEIEHTGGVKDWGYGLVWLMKDSDNFNSFELSADGHFCVNSNQNGEFKKILDWKKDEIINLDAPNVLTVVKQKQTINFYINGKLVFYKNYSEFYNNFFGRRVGVFVRKNQTIEADYLKISTDQGKSVIQSAGDMIIENMNRKMYEENGILPDKEEYWKD
ncbi:MAG: hypothetical protein KGY75_07685 [Candidatus Cloacimonetes bacterium]|nr:hypothetical protein [Candidatus Cloacimonadota bacterium]